MTAPLDLSELKRLIDMYPPPWGWRDDGKRVLISGPQGHVAEVALPSFACALSDAINSLPALVSELEQARAALKPFAVIADEYDDHEDDGFEVWKDVGAVRTIRACFKLEHFRRARAALTQQERGR